MTDNDRHYLCAGHGNGHISLLGGSQLLRGRGEMGCEPRPPTLNKCLTQSFQVWFQITAGVFLLHIPSPRLFFWGYLNGTREWQDDGQSLDLDHAKSWQELSSYPPGSFGLGGDLGPRGTALSLPWLLPLLPLSPSSFLSPSSSSGCAGICGERSRISAKYKPGCSSFQIEQRSRVLSWFL